MALTQEQFDQIEFDNAIQKVHRKMELIRLAKEILVENARIKAVEERDVTAADITAFADTLLTYINS